ncbi:putative cell wall protein [Andrographis paniculata]|uniref:putative cell wall protein n=1 Tax=Andrographis paniculata TaxID=175694 RepID=UPI0021E7095F|nr:putative cell wall protein [Andrographis paniculata]
MASTPQVFFFLLLLVLAVSAVVNAARDTPGHAHVHPQWFGKYDGTVLVPGFGRYMIPKKGQNPLHYNPITGAPTEGHGVSIPDLGYSAPRRYIPGGDDTLLPNPGVEVPIPGGGSGGSVPSSP